MIHDSPHRSFNPDQENEMKYLLFIALALSPLASLAATTPDGREVLDNGCPAATPFVVRVSLGGRFCCEKPYSPGVSEDTGVCTEQTLPFPKKPDGTVTPVINAPALVDCGNGEIGYPGGMEFGSVLFLPDGMYGKGMVASDCCSKRAFHSGYKMDPSKGFGKANKLHTCHPMSIWEDIWAKAAVAEKKAAESLIAKKKLELEALIKLIKELDKK
jgi:hypothetical protein